MLDLKQLDFEKKLRDFIQEKRAYYSTDENSSQIKLLEKFAEDFNSSEKRREDYFKLFSISTRARGNYIPLEENIFFGLIGLDDNKEDDPTKAAVKPIIIFS